ncbi:MAG: DUF4214 domain-containing protein [Desulfovibrionales bacterium]|nr:MAG: DUF4214 domain-containing protein [Desulfovibrionales bacterium]
MTAGGASLTAQWTVNQYTITFDSAGGSAVADITQNFGTAVTAPGDPTRVGHSFAGWSPAVPVAMPAVDLTLTAQWMAVFHVLTVTNGAGSGEYQQGRVASIAANAPPVDHVFDVWTGDVAHVADAQNPNTTVTMPESDVSVAATYRQVTAETHRLSVSNGRGTGDYAPAELVNIQADFPEEGMVFDRWTGDVDHVVNIFNPFTSVTMPAQPVSVTATFKAIDPEPTTYELSVVAGEGDGEYVAGQVVGIAADTPEDSHVFKEWTGDIAHVANVHNPNTTVTMPESSVMVAATYEEVHPQTYTLSVGSGTGSGEYQAGRKVAVAADMPADGMMFERWSGDTRFLDNSRSANTIVAMPNANVSVTALYRERPVQDYRLDVDNGAGTGVYQAGAEVSIAANPAAQGQVFDQWVGQTAQVANVNLPNTTVTMPVSDVTVMATYKDAPEPVDRTLTIKSGIGGGSYTPGRVVTIQADVPAEGLMFDRWVGQTGHVANVNIPNTMVFMPDRNVTITATYKQKPNRRFFLTQRVLIPAQAQERSSQNRNSPASSDQVSELPAGRVVTLNAPAAPAGYIFDKWIGQSQYVDNIHQAETFMYMPDENVDVTASYKPLPPPRTLTVTGGMGDGEYTPGARVDIQADPAPDGQMFDKWEGQTAQVANVNLSRTTLTMPSTAVKIRAVYRDVPVETFDLTVTGGQGSASGLSAGVTRDISGTEPPGGQKFARWTGQTATLENTRKASSTLYMPADNIDVVASFANFHIVTTAPGTGGGISPQTAEVIEYERKTFSIIPDTGYAIESVSGCNGTLRGDAYTTGQISTACTVTAIFRTAPGPGPGPMPPGPDPVEETIDGMVVSFQTQEGTDTGRLELTVSIPVVPTNRSEDVGDAELANIPITFADALRTTVFAQIGLPVGVGATIYGPVGVLDPEDSMEDLLRLIDETAGQGEPDKPLMLAGGTAFLEALNVQDTLTVSKVALISSLHSPSGHSVVVRGTPAGPETPLQAMVIDASALPPGSVIELEDVAFAVIIGQDIRVRGGAGPSILFAGSGTQDILFGMDDDQLHGGAGDDMIGSLGGNDRLFGNAGDDVLFSDQGRNLLHGGLDRDTTRFAGAMDDYEIVRDHAVVTVRSLADPDHVNTLVNVERMGFADQAVDIVYEPYLNMIAALYVRTLGRQPDLEGFQYWADLYAKGMQAGSIVLYLLLSDEAKERGVVMEPGDPATIITMFYREILDRDADQVGLDYWLARHAEGRKLSEIATDLLLSQEARDRGIHLDGQDQNGLDIIEMFYTTLLGRPSDAAGKSYWEGLLAQGVTLREIGALFYASDECQVQGIDIQGHGAGDIVEQFYKWLLGRVSDPEGKAWWVRYFEQTGDWAAVAEGFVGSEEMQSLYVGPTGWEFSVR